MSSMFPNTDPADEELRYAIAEAYGERPPVGLDQIIMDAAMAGRPAGKPVDEPDPIGELEAFKRAVDSMDNLLRSLTPAEWATPALRGLDVQGLIGHLIGVERAFAAGLATDSDPGGEADHVASTQDAAIAQSGRAPADTLDEWRSEVAITIGLVERAGQGDLQEIRSLHGIHLPLRKLLIARTFELWTHSEDIRSAVGHSATAPDGSSLSLMTNLAMDLIPFVVSSTSWRSARIVLTGRGGGTWRTQLNVPGDEQTDWPDDVRIVLDAVDFCRLVANRIDPKTISADVTGDDRLAEDIFAGVAALALD
jgi:uncharacterized protein (TIGR03083 family)